MGKRNKASIIRGACNKSQGVPNSQADNNVVIIVNEGNLDENNSENLLEKQPANSMSDKSFPPTEGSQIDPSHIIFEKNSEERLDELIEVEQDEYFVTENDSSYLHSSSFDEDDIRDFITDNDLLNIKPFIKDNCHKLDEIVKNSKTSDAIITQILIFLGLSIGDLYSIIKDNVRYWVCPMHDCGKLHTRLISLKTHILQHYHYKPFKCDVKDCTWSFYSAFKLKRHKESHSKNRTFHCDEEGCSKRFTTIYNLRIHQKLHLRPKVYNCEVPGCEEIFCTKRELEKHLKIHDPKYAPYKCPLESCGNTYFSYSALTSHSRSHQHKIDELKCKWFNCGKIFDQPCRLKAHLRQHTGDKPYHCQFENCNASFITSSKLRRHERSHANDRRFTCANELCQRKFFRKDHLNEHAKKCKPQVKYSCPKEGCGLSFDTNNLLQKHVVSAHHSRKNLNPRKLIRITKNTNNVETTIQEIADQDKNLSVENNYSKEISTTSNASDVFLRQNTNNVLDYSEISKFYDGITYDNGISVKIGDFTQQTLENNDKELPENTDAHIQENSVPLQIEEWQDIVTLKNCVLSVSDTGVLSVIPNKDDGGSKVLENIEESSALENSKNKEIKLTNLKLCARFLTHDQINALKKMQSIENRNTAQIEIISNEKVVDANEVQLQHDVVNNNTNENTTSSYDVTNFDLSDQYMTLINQNVYEIQEVNNEPHIQHESYLITADKLGMIDESDIDNLNWKFKPLNDSNDEFNFVSKPEQSRTNSLMQYELIESFNHKNTENSLNSGMDDLLAMEDLNDNFYEANENNFTAHNLKDDKNESNDIYKHS